MIPQFDPPVSAEMIRDGGSLALSFCDRGAEFWLFFAIETDESLTERLRYSEPVFANRLTGTKEELSWESAISILELAEAHLESERDRKWRNVMLWVAENRGALPPEVAPFLGSA